MSDYIDPNSITIRIIRDTLRKTQIKDAAESDPSFLEILCRGEMGSKYFTDSVMEENSIIFVEYSDKKIVGIAVVEPASTLFDEDKDKYEDEYYISLVCTKKNNIRLGKMLMYSILDYYCTKACVFYLVPTEQSESFYLKIVFEWEEDHSFMLYSD